MEMSIRCCVLMRSGVVRDRVKEKKAISKRVRAKAHYATKSPRRPGNMRVAVVGCAHGELDLLYDAVAEAARVSGPIDLVLCPGDFQAVRNMNDLQCMACPEKYKDMRSFWRYYSGAATAPVPTLFVGGNHEASNHLQELPFGGLVAPNIYFLGNAGIVTVAGLRIAGISGVYVPHHYTKPRVETPPYLGNQIKSVYHARAEDVNRLLRVSRPVDVVLSHDWPRAVTDHGDLLDLLRRKPFLRSEIDNGSFGNPGTTEILQHLQPRFWFAAHMHVKFPARVRHASGKVTRFLALDKILPRRDFLQILDIPVAEHVQHNSFTEDRNPDLADGERLLELDPEWLAILRTEKENQEGPVTDANIDEVKERVKQAGFVPVCRSLSDFKRTAPVHDPQNAKRGQKPSELHLQARTLAIADIVGTDMSSHPVDQSQTDPEVVASQDANVEGNIDGMPTSAKKLKTAARDLV